jgi:hypothetical protein
MEIIAASIPHYGHDILKKIFPVTNPTIKHTGKLNARRLKYFSKNCLIPDLSWWLTNILVNINIPKNNKYVIIISKFYVEINLHNHESILDNKDPYMLHPLILFVPPAYTC